MTEIRFKNLRFLSPGFFFLYHPADKSFNISKVGTVGLANAVEEGRNELAGKSKFPEQRHGVRIGIRTLGKTSEIRLGKRGQNIGVYDKSKINYKKEGHRM